VSYSLNWTQEATRTFNQNLEYLADEWRNQVVKWMMIGVSIMATQASAIAFLSTPGQAIEDGMRLQRNLLGEMHLEQPCKKNHRKE
jgi:hypothetical protein